MQRVPDGAPALGRSAAVLQTAVLRLGLLAELKTVGTYHVIFGSPYLFIMISSAATVPDRTGVCGRFPVIRVGKRFCRINKLIYLFLM